MYWSSTPGRRTATVASSLPSWTLKRFDSGFATTKKVRRAVSFDMQGFFVDGTLRDAASGLQA